MFSSRFLLLPVSLFVLGPLVQAYPLLLQVDEDSERCFQFQIPSGDDAHLVGVILPSVDDIEDEKVEAWYFDQVYKLTAAKLEKFIPKQFPDELPDYVATQISSWFKESSVGEINPVVVLVSSRPSDRKAYNRHRSEYFQPMVINYISRTTNTRTNRKGIAEDHDIEGYGICIKNKDQESQVQFIMDIVLISEDIPLELEGDGEGFSKERHLTPLEKSLDDSITSAQNILKEMRFMEQRERRMRTTSDNINLRVRWFSYLSVSVLLTVTYIQVTYLKRYFHKKKLM
jgi:hypothetical protein